MKVLPSILASILAACAIAVATPAAAQVLVLSNFSLAHDCYLHAKAGNALTEGVATCTQSLENEPLLGHDLAATYDNRGVMRNALGQTALALADFNASIQIGQPLGDPFVNRGVVLIEMKRYDEALVDINKGIGIGMMLPHIGYYDRGVAEEMSGKAKEAYFDYKHALELQPDFALATARLGDFTVTRTPAPSATP